MYMDDAVIKVKIQRNHDEMLKEHGRRLDED